MTIVLNTWHTGCVRGPLILVSKKTDLCGARWLTPRFPPWPVCFTERKRLCVARRDMSDEGGSNQHPVTAFCFLSLQTWCRDEGRYSQVNSLNLRRPHTAGMLFFFLFFSGNWWSAILYMNKNQESDAGTQTFSALINLPLSVQNALKFDSDTNPLEFYLIYIEFWTYWLVLRYTAHLFLLLPLIAQHLICVSLDSVLTGRV